MPFILIFLNFTKWLEGHMLPCLFQQCFHIECPGCGFQRSVMALLRGDLHTSLTLYPATVPILIMLGFTVLHLKYKFLYGAAFIKLLQFTIALVIVISYCYKAIHF